MASTNVANGRIMPPSSVSSASSETDGFLSRGQKRKRPRRDANVYDAVAGRVTTTLPLEDAPDAATPRHQPRATLRDPTLAPDEVLFRRARAPERFVEKDIYRAHEALPEAGRGVLPDGDMLQAVHVYASHFYAALAAARRRPASDDERSLDETALLAFGVLLEEAAREALGKRGDLVFTEGVEVDEPGPAEGGTSITSVGFLDGGRL